MAAQFVIVTKIQYFMNKIPSWFIGRMGFAGKDDLNGPPPIVEQLFETLQVAEQERCSFVGGESSGKPDGQSFRIQQRASRKRLHRLEMATNPSVPGPFSNKPHEFAPGCLSNGPEGIVRQICDPLPDGWIVDPLRPVGAEVLGIEGIGLR